MLKIAHFIDSPDPGGAESIIIDLCIHAKQNNISVEVLHFGNTWLEEKCLAHNIKSVKVPYHWLYKSIYTVPVFSIFFYLFLKPRKIDIIHTHLFDPIVATFTSAYFLRLRHVATLHDVYAIENSKIKQLLLKLALSLHSRIVSVSEQIIKHLNESGIVKSESVLLIHNGVDLERFTPGDIDRNFPNELGISSDDIVVVSVGRLVPIKAYPNLIKSFYSVVKESPLVKLMIIGDGPEMLNLKRLVEEMDLARNVFLLGQRDDVSDLLKKCDVFVLSSISEGLSCSIIEAMASGLPVLATNVGGNSELVQNNVNGYLVAEGDTGAFSKKLLELVSDGSLRKTFGEKSSNIARAEFSIDSMSGKYIKLYKELSNV